MQKDGLTIITPSFNPGKYLLPCLESVLRQDRAVYQHIVMDGQSTDGSIDVLEKFAIANPKLVWRSEKDAGQSDALCKALEMVETEYFGWLNADDCYVKASIANLCAAAVNLGSQKRPSIVYGDYKVIDDNGAVLRSRRQPSFDYSDCLYSYLTVQNAAAIFRTEDVRRSGGFSRELQFCMDYDLILKLAQIGPVLHVREYVGMFRHHEASKTSNLQNVCKAETEALRVCYSKRSPVFIRFRGIVGKTRVAARMAREGCLASRFGWEER